jgi:hypothetical protein
LNIALASWKEVETELAIDLASWKEFEAKTKNEDQYLICQRRDLAAQGP